ncbi:MAG: SDR family oxidoreductase [Pseudomonadota bacterium]
MELNATFADLAGKHVFITGGGSGIGAALTEGFVRQGSNVGFNGLSDHEPFAQQMRGIGSGDAHYIEADNRDIDALYAAMDQAIEKFGPIDVMVNNAARDDRHGLQDWDVEDWNQSIFTNLRPQHFTAKKVAPSMIERGGGVIINLSSISYMMGNEGYPAYVSAKAGITGLTRGLARELGHHGIRVNAVMPGWIFTERQEEKWATPEGIAAQLERQCLKRKLMPIDMVEPVLFLASKASGAMTSQSVIVDGGVVFGA